ncbi:MAG: alpha/beta hydrolase [Paracoccaceae bacterium]|nr:MAG: alpha/beta hydrolase [Paracoccaceae bacterium]
MISRRSALSVAAGLLLLGCGPAVQRRAAEREREAETAYPPTGRLIDVAGRKVHAQTEGQGPDVVLIHGASGNLRDFTFSFMRRLTGRYRVTAFDRPGLGWSDDLGEAGLSPVAQADHLRAAAAVLGLRRPVVLGHSYGGAVAMAWALRDPSVRGVVALSGATMPWPGGLGPWYAITSSAIGGATVVPLISAYASLERAEGAVAGIFAPAPVPPGYVAHVGAGLTLRRDTLRANARQVNALKPYLQAMSGNYARLTVPVEIVHGTADTIVPHRTHAEPLAALLPAARLTLIEGAGHMPHHSHPETVVAALRRLAV